MIVGMIVTNDAIWKSEVLKEYDIELGFKWIVVFSIYHSAFGMHLLAS